MLRAQMDEDRRVIKLCLSPLLSEPPNSVTVALIGPASSGKTLLAKSVHRWFLRNSPSNRSIYLNCRSMVSEVEAVSQILRGLGGSERIARGVSLGEAMEAVFQTLSLKDRRLLLVFDDIDSLMLRGRSFFLVLLPKIYEQDSVIGNRIGTIFTSRNDDIFRRGLPFGSFRLIRLPRGGLGQTVKTMRSDDALWKTVRGQVNVRALGRKRRMILEAISEAQEVKDGFRRTGDIERVYVRRCLTLKERPLCHTRIWEILRELDAFTVIERKVVDQGNKGRTTFVRLTRDVHEH